MSLVSGVVVYQVIWWIVLFAVLPMDAEPDSHPEKGHETGAPKHPHMKKKLIITTIIATVLWFMTYLIIENEWFILV